MSIDPRGRLRAADDVLSRRVRDEVVLLHLGSEAYFGLDAVGTAMWEALCATGSEAGAHAVLTTEFDVEPGRLTRDLRALVDQLLHQGLLVVE